MITTLLTIVFLIAMWVAVLAAPVLRNRGSAANRTATRGGDSIKTFQRQLATLERATPYRSPAGRPATPGRSRPLTARVPEACRSPLMPTQQAARRRRQVLAALLGAVVISLGLALLAGGWFVVAHLLADALLVGYVVLMLRTLRLAAEREMKVAFLPHRNPGAEPTALLQQVGRRSHG